MVAIAPKQIINSLKSVVSSVYKEGADQILSWPQIDERGYMKFRFRGGAQVYDCEISPDGIISYIKAQRSDSILLGAYFGPIAQYIEDSEYITGLLEAEILRLDGKKCRIGKSCGVTCITVNDKCSQMLGLQQKRAVESIRNAVSDRAKKGPNNNVVPLVAAGVGAGLVGAGLIAAGAIAMSNKEGGNSTDTSSPTQQPVTPPPPPPPPRPPVTPPPPSPPTVTPPIAPPPPPPSAPETQIQVAAPELKFSAESVGKINAGISAIDSTFDFGGDELNKGFSVKAKAPADKSYGAMAKAAAQTMKKEGIKEFAGEFGKDLLNGGIFNPVQAAANAFGKTMGKAALDAVKARKAIPREKVVPDVDFATKTIRVPQDSPAPDMDFLHGMGQYMYQVAQQDPKKAEKVNEFVRKLTSSVAHQNMTKAMAKAKNERVIRDLEFDLQPEQVFARAVKQYVAVKNPEIENQNGVVMAWEARSGGRQWGKGEFQLQNPSIQGDMDKLFGELGWLK